VSQNKRQDTEKKGQIPKADIHRHNETCYTGHLTEQPSNRIAVKF